MPVRLATRTWGEGGRSALLLHGVSSSASGWWRVGPDLARLGYRVVAPDLRGHGNSPTDTDYSIRAYVADVVALAARWDLVLGHSLGGVIAAVAAEQDPAFCRRLILEDPPLDLADPDAALEWLIEAFLHPITEERLRSEHPRWADEDVAFKVEALRQTSPHILEETIRASSGELAPILERLRVPTLLIGADPDQEALVTPAEGRRLAAANRHLEFVWIAGAGHSIHREEYPAFWAAVAEFAGRS